MPTCTSIAVAARFLRSSTDKRATVVHVDRDGRRWGWFSDNTPRVHLVPFDAEYRGRARVWLEDGRGNRSFQVEREPLDPELDLDALRASVTRTRDSIESAWLRSCSLKGWLDYDPNPATILLYSGEPCQIKRCLWGWQQLEPAEMQVEPGVGILYLGLKLNRVIWRGADDGSDACSELPPGNPWSKAKRHL